MRSEAADWVARLDNAPTRETLAEFEHWLAEDPRRRAAYDQAASRYSQSILLRQSKVTQNSAFEDVFPGKRHPIARAALAASVAGLVVLATVHLSRGFEAQPALQAVMLTAGSAAQEFKLKDGSAVRLAPASALQVDLTQGGRQARLTKGNAHIRIARDERPFVLKAGASEAQAREGEYDLSLADGEGIVRASSSEISMSSSERDKKAAVASVKSPRILEFKATPLLDVAEAANAAGGATTLEIDPRVASHRVTGLFHATDSSALARSLAAALDLQLVQTTSGSLRLEPRQK